MKFKYRAYAADDPTRQVEDTLDADSRAEAASMLRRNGFVPIEIKIHKAKGFDINNIQITPHKVKLRELALFTRQFATMIRAGMSPLQSLDVVMGVMKNQWFKECLVDVKDAINTGSDLSSAFARHPKIFSPLYISLIKAGEAGGQLPEALDRLAIQMEKDAQMKGEIKSAMVYPAIVVIFAMLILTAMLLFVVPTFASIFKDTGGKLPALTQYLVDISNLVRSYWFLMPLLFFGIKIGVDQFLKNPKGREWWDNLKLKFPLKIGTLYVKVVTARFTRTLSTLYGAGVPVLQAMEITAPTTNNVIVQKAIEQATNDLKTGTPISVAIKDAHIFPDMATAMISAGEQSGEISDMLAKVADTYEEEVEIAIKGLKSLMEPIMIMVIGGIVGTTVIALYLPIFKVYDQIK